jgi:hypothetical protein
MLRIDVVFNLLTTTMPLTSNNDTAIMSYRLSEIRDTGEGRGA